MTKRVLNQFALCKGSIKQLSFTLLLILSFSALSFSQHPAGPRKKIGTVTQFYDQLRPAAGQANSRISREKTLQTSEEALSVLINVSKSDNGSEVILGEIKGSKASNVSFTVDNGKLNGFAVMPEEEKAYTYSSDPQGNVYVEETDIHEVLCINFTEPENAAGTGGDVPLAVPPSSSSSVYSLQSLPGVTAVAYLDFDGEYVSGTRWNGGNPIDAQPGNFSEASITNIWKMIAEDFRPFNINITTDLAIFNAAPKNRRMRCIFTPTNTAAPGSGGVAYLRSFSWNDDTPCWVFNSGTKAAGEAGSHELGHTFGLSHDGTPSTGYYSGHGIWAPIMGVGYSKGLTQWSRGEYANANQTQDDVAIIANTTNGFGYRTDDAGNTISTAKALAVESTGTVNASQNYGIITQRTDIDVYSFTTSGGIINLTANPSPTYPDLDILLTLRNASGTVVATANPTASAPGSQTGSNPITGLAASLTVNLSPGAYYLHVDGTGQGDPLSTGYSDYASLGEYTISGTVPVTIVNQAPTVAITAPSNGASFITGANIAVTASASDSDGSVTSVAFYNGTLLLGTDTAAPYSFTISNAAAGTYNLRAVATDNNGAQGNSSIVAVTVASPNTAPVVSITAPANGASFTAGSNILVTASASDTDGSVASVAFYNGTTLLGTDVSSPYSFTIANVAAGSYSLRAVATDNNGAQGSSSIVAVTVTSPNAAPAVTITAPANGASFTTGANILVTASASDSDGTVSSVSFYNGTTLLGTDTAAPYSFTISNAVAGTYNLRAVATDNNGAQGYSSIVAVTVANPNTAPVVSITAPANGASFTVGSNILVTASASDTDGSVANVAFYNGTTLLGTDLSAPYSFSIIGATAGTYSLRATATDNSGAQGSSSIVSITVTSPNTAPTVTITSPANGASFTTGANILVTASASDTDGSVASVSFYNGTTLLGTDLSAPYSFSIANAAAGTYTLTATAVDNEGAQGFSEMVTVVVSTPNTAPVVTITSPANGTTFPSGTNIAVTANASDSDGSVASVAFYNGTQLLGTDVSSPYSFTIPNAAAGTYSLRAIATDNNSAQGTSSVVTITVEPSTTAPGINGPSCVNPGQAYLFVLSEEGPYTNINWWTNAQAIIEVDPADKRRVYVTYAYPGSSISLTAGVNYSSSPWYKQYDKILEIGTCSPVAGAVLAAPHPFIDQTTLSVNTGEKILSVKLYDIHGQELINARNINDNKITIGNNLKAGVYIIHVVTESSTLIKNLIKSE